MAVTEDKRHELYKGLEEVMDTQRATTLMELLPPVGWADVATKQDVEGLRRDMNHRFEQVDKRFDVFEHKLDARLERTLRRFQAAVYTANVGLAAAVVAAVKLI